MCSSRLPGREDLSKWLCFKTLTCIQKKMIFQFRKLGHKSVLEAYKWPWTYNLLTYEFLSMHRGTPQKAIPGQFEQGRETCQYWGICLNCTMGGLITNQTTLRDKAKLLLPWSSSSNSCLPKRPGAPRKHWTVPCYCPRSPCLGCSCWWGACCCIVMVDGIGCIWLVFPSAGSCMDVLQKGTTTMGNGKPTRRYIYIHMQRPGSSFPGLKRLFQIGFAQKRSNGHINDPQHGWFVY